MRWTWVLWITGALLALALVVERDSRPISDFLLFWSEGIRWHETGTLSERYKFFQGPGQPMLLSVAASLWGHATPKVVPYLNVVLYLLGCYLLWRVLGVSEGWPRRVGLALLLCSPFMLPLLAVLSSEASFSVVWTLAHAGLAVFVRRPPSTWAARIGLATGIGLAMGAAQIIRPIAVHHLLMTGVVAVGLGVLSWARARGQLTLSPALQAIVPAGVAVGVCIALATAGYAVADYEGGFIPNQHGSGAFFAGSNAKTAGRFDPLDAKFSRGLGDSLQWDAAKIRPILYDTARKRAAQNVWPLLQRWPLKFQRLHNATGIWEYVLRPDANRVSALVPLWRALGWALSGIAALFMLLNYAYLIRCLWGLWRGQTLTRLEWLFTLLIGTALAYAVAHAATLEIAGRFYAHYYLLHAWLAPVALIGFFQRSASQVLNTR